MNDDSQPVSLPPFPADYRASGLLLHLTSLPSPYGIGDVGPGAIKWIDRLQEAGQSWWQALPLGHQTQEYQDMVLPPEVTARVAVEEASTFGWERYIGRSGRMIGMKTFGASAPLKELQKKFGFEPDKVAAAAKELLGRN